MNTVPIQAIRIFDINGAMVLEDNNVDMMKYSFGANFKPGFYVIEVICEGKPYRLKILKQ